MVHAKELFTWNPTFLAHKEMVYALEDESIHSPKKIPAHSSFSEEVSGDDSESDVEEVSETIFGDNSSSPNNNSDEMGFTPEVFEIRKENDQGAEEFPSLVNAKNFPPITPITKDKREIVIRNKARLVAQGYTQEEWIEYDETKEKVYVCQQLGFEDPYFPDRVYKVKKALCGLHQAPRAWYETSLTYLLDNGFQKGKIDKTLFIKRNKGDILLIQVYVDDIIFGSTKKELCNVFERLMHEKFQMSSMGELTFFLGLQVKEKKDRIFISQDKYVSKILKKFGFTKAKTASTPMENQKPMLKDEDGKEVDVYMYRSMIGSLMYLTSSRPNIMFAEEPKKVIHVLKDPRWIEAIQEELLQFKLQEVWTLVDLPNGKKAIGTKWVFKNKKDKREIVIRNKARLVAQGYTQEEWIEYDEVFFPVARIEAIRLFLAYASFKDFVVYQIDVKSAFLFGKNKEKVYLNANLQSLDQEDDLCEF
nr:hypothetical protein [Tanacetum cinerariifolium]